jgi:hypothetical protein
MQVLAVVNLMTFLIVALLLFLLATPQDRRRARGGKSGEYPSSDAHRPAPAQSNKGEAL